MFGKPILSQKAQIFIEKNFTKRNFVKFHLLKLFAKIKEAIFFSTLDGHHKGLVTAGYVYDTFAYEICFYGYMYFCGLYIYGIYFYRALKFIGINCTVVRNT